MSLNHLVYQTAEPPPVRTEGVALRADDFWSCTTNPGNLSHLPVLNGQQHNLKLMLVTVQINSGNVKLTRQTQKAGQHVIPLDEDGKSTSGCEAAEKGRSWLPAGGCAASLCRDEKVLKSGVVAALLCLY